MQFLAHSNTVGGVHTRNVNCEENPLLEKLGLKIFPDVVLSAESVVAIVNHDGYPHYSCNIQAVSLVVFGYSYL